MKTKQELADCRATFDATVERMKAERAELLASLTELLKLCEGGAGNALQKMDRARSAIAKAERGAA